jgi:hypothetical protein
MAENMPFNSGTVGASEVAKLLIEGTVFFANSCKGKCSGFYVRDCPKVAVVNLKFFKNVAFHGTTVMPYSSTLTFTRVIFAGNEGARVSALLSSTSTITFTDTKFLDYRDSSMLIAKRGFDIVGYAFDDDSCYDQLHKEFEKT